ncbi:hypothetical protein [Micromonospora sp. DT233]|uniref:hypothetical protein n=1 Tax=Micromonospora sp. DT233 TaxID=3393432 RepID=UPI003CF3DD28
MTTTTPPVRRWRSRAVAVAAVAFAVACIGAPARQAVVRAFEAGRGEQTPTAAAQSYLAAVFESGDSAKINQCLCADNRDELFRQARDLRKQVDQQATFGLRVETSGWQSIGSEEGTLTVLVSLRTTTIDPATGGVSFPGGDAHAWRFTAKEEGGLTGDGWKVCRVDAPPLCGTYFRC